MVKGRGSVQEYPCDCDDHGNPRAVCWIVRHPSLLPPISYKTRHGANIRLGQLRKKYDAADQDAKSRG
jgi:hypothetical protein